MRKKLIALLFILLSVQGICKAETWPSLDDYVAKCVLIVKAKATVENNQKVTFEVLETWKGVYDPKSFINPLPEGRYVASMDEHGVVNVNTGQEVILFFTYRNQSDSGKIGRHSTAFVVRDGRVRYPGIGRGIYGIGTGPFLESSVPEFKTIVRGFVEQEEKLLQSIDALSLEQLKVLKTRIDMMLTEKSEQERKKWQSLLKLHQPAVPDEG